MCIRDRSVADVAALEVRDPDRLAYLTQTTLSVDETTAILAALKARFPNVRGPAREDVELTGAAAYLVESVADVDPAWLEDKKAIGVTAGASTPEHLVQDLVKWLGFLEDANVRQLRA